MEVIQNILIVILAGYMTVAAELSGTAAKNFRFCTQLNMRFKAGYHFIFHRYDHSFRNPVIHSFIIKQRFLSAYSLTPQSVSLKQPGCAI